MIKYWIAYLSLIFSSQIGWTQKAVPMKWGKIDPAHLSMKTYDRDTSAEAVVLCNFGKIEVEYLGDSWKYRFSHHKRIKILKESGFRYGEVVIPYYKYKKSEGLSPIKAQVFAPNGEKVVVNKKEIFDEDYNEYWSASKLAMPNIQVGSVIEYKYEIVSGRLTELREWQFQEAIPTIYSELQVAYPSYFAYSYLFQGGEYMERTSEEDVTVLEGDNGTIKLGEGWFVMENAVAMKNPERFITTMDDYVAKIRFQLNKIYYQDGRESSFLSTWEKLAQELEYHDQLGAQYLKRRNHKKMLEAVIPLVNPQLGQAEKANFLYQFFNENMEDNGIRSIYVKTSLDDVFEKKTGRVAEINLMLLAALKNLEITAYPILVSTREHGKMYEKYPLVNQFNHLMVYAILDGKPTILDCGNDLRPMGMPHISALNGRGWVVEKDNPRWVDIVPLSSREAYTADLKLDEEGVVTGSLKGAYLGYNAIPERAHYEENRQGEHWRGRLEDKYPEVRIEEVTFNNLEEAGSIFSDEIKLNIQEAGQVIGDYIYFSPVLFSNFEKNIFKLEKRHYPVDIPYPINEQYILNLTLPENYKVEELPKSARFMLPEKSGSFSFIIEQESETELKLVSRISVKKLHFSPLEYSNIKELFDLVSEKYGEQIVLKKQT